MQANVKEMYLKVIETTIENARAEFADNGVAAGTVAHLETLRQRWRERLLQTQDFSEDPMLMRGGGSASSSRSAGRGGRGGQIVSVGPTGLPPTRGGPVASAAKVEATAVGATTPGAGGAAGGRGTKRKADEAGQPNKRARRATEEDDDDSKYKDDSDLGSSSGDSDIQSAGSDPEVDNFILAQHDRVRKGGKWKVQLKEGIAHINGRDYLFNRATCDLEW